MYAIVECGGRQYRAEAGHSFSVEKLPQEVGEQIELDNVLLLSNDGNITVGRPTITGASVTATVTDQYRGKKIFVWKYKPKKRYRRRRGHRQYYTRLRIDAISVDGNAAKVAEPVKESAAVVQDDLTLIEGVGPKIQEALQAAGISTMVELSATSAERLQDIVKEAGISARSDTWPKQARLAASGDMAALKAYQDELDGGVAN